MSYTPIPPPNRRPMGELNDEKREYLKELHQWLNGYDKDEELQFPNGIVRDREFFLDLVDKVRIIEGYSQTDRVWLDLITREHWRSKKE